MIRVYTLGTGGAGAPPGRAQNCILLETRGTRLLLDAGPGCAQRLQEVGIEPHELDAIYISHRHVDHVAGLFDISVHSSATGRPMPRILAAVEGLTEIEAAARLHVVSSVATSLRVEPVTAGHRLGDLTLDPVPSSHPATCHGVIAADTEGNTVYYSADTALTSRIEEAVSRARLSLLEATLPPGMEDAAGKIGHMTVAQATSLAARAPQDATIALIHLTAASMPHAIRANPPRNTKATITAPSDLTVFTL